jgi:hypothetical protein
MIEKHPDYKDEIESYYELCVDSIDAGESQQNEIELCYSSIKQLISEP